MDDNDHTRRMYQQQQYPERSQTTGHGVYGASTTAARFRHPSAVQPSPSIDSSPTFGEASHGFVDPGHFSGSAMSSGFHYPQFTSAEPMVYSTQSHHQASQYGQTYFYGNQQATPTTEEVSQDQTQPYSAGAMRNPSTTSTSSQYSMPHTPQSQFFGSNQSSQFSSRTDGVTTPSASASFDSVPFTQDSYSRYRTSGQMLPPSSLGSHGAVSQQPQLRSTQQVDEAYELYQNKAKEIFTLVRDGRIRETQSHLLYISQYLLGNVDALGLDKDDKHLYEERLKLWDTFNHTWLTALQAQLDLTSDMISRGGRSVHNSQSLLDVEDMEKLGHELVRLCDAISVFGLVDYQMGVAEEEILELLIRCLDLLDPSSDSRQRPSDIRGRQRMPGPLL